MHRNIFYFLIFLCLIPDVLEAGTKGRIRGKVVDLQTGEPLIGANVIVMRTSNGSSTDDNGEYILQNLEPGVYNVRASYLGYQTITIQNVRVRADLTQYVNFELPNEDIQVGTVEIVAQKPLIQKDNTNAVRITTGDDIEQLPIRGFNNILALTPGVSTNNDEFHIRGGRADEVGYYIEGVSVRNPRGGGRAVTIPQNALEEIQVQSGGYPAEFGGANSGIVRSTFKSGGSQLKVSLEYLTDNIGFQSASSAFNGEKRLGTYWWGYDETNLSVSGPLFDQRIKFFVNGNYQFNRSGQHPDQPAINLGNVWNQNEAPSVRDTVNLVYNNGAQRKAARNYYTFTGTVNLDFKPLLFRISGTYYIDDNDANATGPYNVMNDRPGKYKNRNGSFNIKMTHVLSSNLFYELSAGYVTSTYRQQDKALGDNYWAYGDSVANAAVGYVWSRSPQDLARGYTGQYATPRQIIVYDWRFNRTGAVNVGFNKSSNTSLNFTAALNWMPNKYHTFKIGGEYQGWTYRSYNPGTGSGINAIAKLLANGIAANTAQSVDQVKTDVLRNSGAFIYGYDFAGNDYDGSDDIFHAPHKPVFASAYIQDKIEYEDIILNLGLRYDYYDIDNLRLIDQSHPELSIVKATNTLLPGGWERVSSFSAVSPRIGISFPVNDKTVFHSQFGKFVQQPDLNESYVGYDYYAWQLTTGYFFENMRGLDLRPERTTQYELGFSQEVADFMSFDVTAYYKDIKDLVQMTFVSVNLGSGYINYYARSNSDFATTKGVEIALNMRRFQRIQVNGSLTFQDSKGTGSYPNSNRGIVGYPVIVGQPYTPKNISPLEFDRPFLATMNIDYRFGENDGPAWLSNAGVNILITYRAGRPFTRGTGNPALVGISQAGSGDARFRVPIEPLGSSEMPGAFNIDLRIEKSFALIDRLTANIYLTITNLLNTKNVEEVYLLTGTNTDDGYLSNPTTYQQQLNIQGQTYIDMYQLLNIDRNGLWGPMRDIRLGVILEY